MPRILLLGPQRQNPTVAAALEALDADGPVCAVTAGWQEREGETEELEEHLRHKVTDLNLYHLAEEAFERDAEFLAAHRERQNRLQEQQRLYRLRLPHLLDAVRELQDLDSPAADLLTTARREALAAVRSLDEHHLAQIRRIHGEFEARYKPVERPVIAKLRDRLAGQMDKKNALLIAGGHVGVLLSRLRLFGIDSLIGDKPIVAWSAGAMALCEKIVLFHDHPPQGPSDPEVLDAGLGLVKNLIPLPHAGQRLNLEDPARVARFAGRFAPALCATLEAGAMLHWNGRTLIKLHAARCLNPDGKVVEVAVL